MFLKLTLDGQSDKAFLLTSKFCPQGTCGITLKNMYKIRVERDFLKLATNDESDKAFLLASNF